MVRRYSDANVIVEFIDNGAFTFVEPSEPNTELTSMSLPHTGDSHVRSVAVTESDATS